MSKIKKIISKNLESLFEGDYSFDEMEVAFGVKEKSDNLTDEEKNQFGDMEDAEEVLKANYNQQDPPAQSSLNKVQKDASKEATEYYKDVLKKMRDYQTSDQEELEQSKIGEAFEPKKRNAEETEEDMGLKGPTGTGMEGLRYDDEETENYEAFEERIDDLNGGDEEGTTYGNMKKAGKEYKQYKYGDKYDEAENEYQETPRVRVTQKENTMKYADVIKENIFKTTGKITSEEQVIKLTKKVPNRVKIDETVFAITDGDNTYRLIWEGSEEDGEAIITHHKNKKVVNESIEKMKHLWGFNPKDVISTKKTIKEGSTDDVFKKMLNKVRNPLMTENEEEVEVCEECGKAMCECGTSYMEEEDDIKNPGKYMGGKRQEMGIDDDGDGVPDGDDKNPKDGSKK